ncbi:MAG: 1-(5-phosphoribosyl)-5-[(5-phosphoribosylamino)methylideneamino]imidazole-4-carboxamide isomerase [Ruminococcaceae bacterium]|nr:1-(5-phosphoribosyl)-5-[(5-phosphoribosylamino)methylideneamino]imidazole-4-carboxamide isomerase [Oscillospiraceae bacterium]
MIVYPAIDLRGGKCVRLLQGDFDKTTVYSDSPLATAKKWEAQGAGWLHLVDLDGARQEKSDNRAVICEIAKALSIPVQTGGGIRSMADIEELLSAGLSRVILGTAAVQNPALAREAADRFGDRIAVGIDAKDGYAAISGWEEVSNRDAVELAVQMKEYGIRHLIYTDIATDGMLSGPNLAAMTRMAEAFGPGVIASGGVSREQDLLELLQTGVSGAIVGKALYTGSIDLEKAIKTVKEASNAD